MQQSATDEALSNQGQFATKDERISDISDEHGGGGDRLDVESRFLFARVNGLLVDGDGQWFLKIV